jgi:hypothetical protein
VDLRVLIRPFEGLLSWGKRPLQPSLDDHALEAVGRRWIRQAEFFGLSTMKFSR